MKKSEVQAVVEAHRATIYRARSARQGGDYAGAIREATSAWDSVDVVVKYERAQDREPNHVPAFEIVTDCAPPMMDFRSLNRLADFLAANKRLARLSDGRPLKVLEAARAKLWDCHKLWTEIEREPGLLQSSLSVRLGGAARHWAEVLSVWNSMGLTHVVPDGSSLRVSLATRLGGLVPGKCPACGRVEEAPKAMLLDALGCPGCGNNVSFVIVG